MNSAKNVQLLEAHVGHEIYQFVTEYEVNKSKYLQQFCDANTDLLLSAEESKSISKVCCLIFDSDLNSMS